VTVKTQIRILVIGGCLLPIISVVRYSLDPRTQLSFPAMMGNIFNSAIMLYLAKRLHDKSKPPASFFLASFATLREKVFFHSAKLPA